MTTHDALSLQPGTLVRWLPPAGVVPGTYTGVARKDGDRHIRIVWDDLAEADSLIMDSDRRILSSFEIYEPKTDANLDDH